jgi:hypothetical protein
MPANPLLSSYDPKRVIVTYGGVPIGGYADGTFVNITPGADNFSPVVGADGEVARAMSNNNTHTVEITLLQSSLSNEYLSLCKNADKLTGLGMLPLQILDANGGTLFFWPQAWISKDPNYEFGNDITDRNWTFETGQIAAQNEGGIVL